MLKLTFSNTYLLVEQIDLSLEAVVTQRSLVALRAGQPFVAQPSYGSFSLPADLPGLQALRSAAPGAVELAPCDDHWLEVTLRGTWLADSATSAEGILLAELGFALERQLVALWQQSLKWAIAPCRQG